MISKNKFRKDKWNEWKESPSYTNIIKVSFKKKWNKDSDKNARNNSINSGSKPIREKDRLN
jgi:hypothetical protein